MKKSLFALLMGGLGIGTTEFVIMGLLEDVAKDLAISIPVAGHLISAYALGVVVGAPLLVLLTGNIAPKKLLFLLMVMFTVFNGLSMLATGYDFLLITRFLSGLPHGAFFGVGAVVASRLADKGKEARAVAVMFAGLTIANILGVPLGTYVGHHYNWHYAFGIIVAIGLITLMFIHFWMPVMKVEKQKSIVEQLTFLARKESWLLIATIAIGTGGLFCWISYISPLLTKVSMFKEESVSYILVLAGLGMFFGNWFGARLADRFSPAYTTIGLLLFMVLSLALVYVFAPMQIATLAMTFITGAASFALIAPIQMLIIGSAKGSEMLAAAVSQAAFNIGNALGAFLGGIPLAYGYSYRSPVWVGVGMALIGSFTAWLFVLSNRKVKPEILTELK